MESQPTIDIPVGKTALYTCAERAHECTSQKVPLFHDPKAAILAGKGGFDLLYQFQQQHKGLRSQSYSTSVVIRTKFIDEVVKWAVKEEGTKQVVIIAAGMDTRVYRLDLDADVVVYEVDFKQVLDYKYSVLSVDKSLPKCKHVTLGLDLTQAWTGEFLKNGYDIHKKAVWIIEGLFIYLEEVHICKLLESIGLLMCDGSILVGDWMNTSYLTSKLTESFRRVFSSFHSPFITGSDYDNCLDLFKKYGFVLKIYALGDEHNNFNRVPTNQVKVARDYPISDPEFNDVPRHFLFLGEKSSKDDNLSIERKFGKITKSFSVRGSSPCASIPKNIPKEELKLIVRRVVRNTLSIDTEITDDTSLVDVGLDSLSSIQLYYNLQQELNHPLYMSHIFKNDTVNTICGAVEQQFTEK